MRGFLIILFLLVFQTQVSYSHPIHVSICNIEIDKEALHVGALVDSVQEVFDFDLLSNTGGYPVRAQKLPDRIFV